MRIRTAFIFAVFSAAIVFFPFGGVAAPEYKIKIGSLVTPQSAWGKAVRDVIRDIEKKSGGRVKIEHLHSGMLGGEQSMMEMVMLGGIHAAGLPASTLATLVPEMNVLELPFLFEDYDEAYYLIDNVIEPRLREKLAEKGLLTSAFMENGFMEFVAPRFIHKPEDLHDLKIGCWENPMHIAFWKALGAKPIPMPVTEVMSAHARGIVNSGANSINAVFAWDHLFGSALKRNELYVTEARFSYQAGVLVMNRKTWKTFPEDVQKTVLEGLSRMTPVLREKLRAAENEARAALKKRGYNLAEMTGEEKAVFIKRTGKLYGEFEKQIGADFLKKVLAERDKYRKSVRGKREGKPK